MGDEIIKSLFAVAAAIVGIAIVSVIVSSHSSTAGVIQAAGAALSTDISAAVSPVTGGGSSGLGGLGGLGNISSLGGGSGLVYA
jgi:PRD1 phage membrane DNA delivery